MKATFKNIRKILYKLADYLEEDEFGAKEFCKKFNIFLDELLSDDFFGTEGQCDPRGDRRQWN